MLTVKQRETYLKELGYYNGKIDGKEGPKLKKAYLQLQKDYFFRKSDKDGKYGPATDKLLVDVYRVKKYSPSFDIKKNKMYCHCKGKYCTGYPAYLSIYLLKNLQSIQNKFGKTTFSSVLRCQKWNDLQTGSAKYSKHIDGRAADYRGSYTRSLKGRKECMNYWFKLLKPNYTYCNGYFKTSRSSGYKSASGMGTSVHGDVSK